MACGLQANSKEIEFLDSKKTFIQKNTSQSSFEQQKNKLKNMKWYKGHHSICLILLKSHDINRLYTDCIK